MTWTLESCHFARCWLSFSWVSTAYLAQKARRETKPKLYPRESQNNASETSSIYGSLWQSQLIAMLQKCGVAILCLRIHISGVLQELADNFRVTESDQVAECSNHAIDCTVMYNYTQL